MPMSKTEVCVHNGDFFKCMLQFVPSVGDEIRLPQLGEAPDNGCWKVDERELAFDADGKLVQVWLGIALEADV